MSQAFIDTLCETVLTCSPQNSTQHALIGRAIADTLGVAAAGFAEPVTRNFLAAYGGQNAATWAGFSCESTEAAIMINAVAAHALDFDDVYLESTAHISAVLLPTILSGSMRDPEIIFSAFAAGLITAKAVAHRIGPGHYHKGWHGTSTIGAFAAAAAFGRLIALNHEQMASAFSLAGAMSGGLKINFSTQAKPAQAGFAAVAGVRAARLAKSGVTGARDIFSAGGFPDLYGIGDGSMATDDTVFSLRPDKISVKLFPCCYAAHRLIGIALDARAEGNRGNRSDTRYRLTVPAGSIEVLRYDRPKDAAQARFSAPFCFAVALLDGPPTLHSFTDESVKRADIGAIFQKLIIVEDERQPSGGDIEMGTARLDVLEHGSVKSTFVRAVLPGSPEAPPDQETLAAKLTACLSVFENAYGETFRALELVEHLGLQQWFRTPASLAGSTIASAGRAR